VDADALRFGNWIERGVEELIKRIRVRVGGKARWVRMGGFGGGGGGC
jgi:hypothetical protein